MAQSSPARYTLKKNIIFFWMFFESSLDLLLNIIFFLDLLSTPERLFQNSAPSSHLMSNYCSNRSTKGLCGIVWLSWKLDKKFTQLCSDRESVRSLVFFFTAIFFPFESLRTISFFLPSVSRCKILVRVRVRIPVTNTVSNNWVVTVYLSLPDPRVL